MSTTTRQEQASGLNASVVCVTPEVAKHWLDEYNVKNRPFKPQKIQSYARDMMNGRWQMTGEAIKFAGDGTLLDGQNRLAAVMRADMGVYLFIVRGLQNESQDVMDSGSARTPADSLGMHGVAQATSVAPAAAALLNWSAGRYLHCMMAENKGATKAEITEYVETHPDLSRVVDRVARVRKDLPLPIGALGAAGYRFFKIDHAAFADFFDRIGDLNYEPGNDPIKTLAQRVARDRGQGARIQVPKGLFYLSRAWNAYRRGQQLRNFVLGTSANGYSKIPEPK